MPFPSNIRRCAYTSPLGPMTLAATDSGLAGVWFDGQRHMPDTAGWQLRPDDPLLRRAAAELDAYFAGERSRFDLPLDLGSGTPFQQQVWRALLTIAHGQRSTYAGLSQSLGRPEAVRAVGAAVGRNPISLIVPCHRVLGADGSLTGYAGGLPRKAALLRLESAESIAA
jgi:methylated-DNA-[protein]-cysteine S-methyltransferase